jgi:hypothetical protein
MSSMRLFALAAAALVTLAACKQTPPAETLAAAPPAAKAEAASIAVPAAAAPMLADKAPRPVTVNEASFACIRNLTPVRGFYVGNIHGDAAPTIAVAEAGQGVYPPGSIVQLVPTEAMVKHEAGWNPATKDWEYFELVVAPGSTRIHVRGGAEVVNRFGGSCHTCHVAATPERDLICEQGHGCAPIPITPVMAKAIQNTDPRCEKMELPPEQIEALKALAAFAAASAPKP